jgi:hypothetical protein
VKKYVKNTPRMNAKRSINPRSEKSNGEKYVGSSFIARFFHKPWDTNPNKYPSITPRKRGIENEGEVSMQTIQQILFDIYTVIQARLLV